jgi:hypothetical protein
MYVKRETNITIVILVLTNDWEKHSIILNIENVGAYSVELGIFLSKSGAMWVNGIKFREKGF